MAMTNVPAAMISKEARQPTHPVICAKGVAAVSAPNPPIVIRIAVIKGNSRILNHWERIFMVDMNTMETPKPTMTRGNGNIHSRCQSKDQAPQRGNEEKRSDSLAGAERICKKTRGQLHERVGVEVRGCKKPHEPSGGSEGCLEVHRDNRGAHPVEVYKDVRDSHDPEDQPSISKDLAGGIFIHVLLFR